MVTPRWIRSVCTPVQQLDSTGDCSLLADDGRIKVDGAVKQEYGRRHDLVVHRRAHLFKELQQRFKLSTMYTW
jgi:hypothetical protein